MAEPGPAGEELGFVNFARHRGPLHTMLLEKRERSADLGHADSGMAIGHSLQGQIGMVADGNHRGAAPGTPDSLGHRHGEAAPASQNADGLSLKRRQRHSCAHRQR